MVTLIWKITPLKRLSIVILGARLEDE